MDIINNIYINKILDKLDFNDRKEYIKNLYTNDQYLKIYYVDNYDISLDLIQYISKDKELLDIIEKLYDLYEEYEIFCTLFYIYLLNNRKDLLNELIENNRRYYLTLMHDLRSILPLINKSNDMVEIFTYLKTRSDKENIYNRLSLLTNPKGSNLFNYITFFEILEKKDISFNNIHINIIPYIDQYILGNKDMITALLICNIIKLPDSKMFCHEKIDKTSLEKGIIRHILKTIKNCNSDKNRYILYKYLNRSNILKHYKDDLSIER